ncbi:gas vesicle protein GvpM [Halorussus halophilus]|uniref:gas vesicle protein GvpM n=1 Tax=Halorussus halophilus TaxID=2650975 RepID=UPI001301289F|nr:gas vesicle protein [Halorussus halophilus]
MKPQKDDHAVVDLLDALLAEGALLQADVILTVADVPLVGINLRAAIAGMATMREYGFFEAWDEEIRASGREAERSDCVGLDRTGERASRERRRGEPETTERGAVSEERDP